MSGEPPGFSFASGTPRISLWTQNVSDEGLNAASPRDSVIDDGIRAFRIRAKSG